jgi:hypothetical protein
MTQVYQN